MIMHYFFENYGADLGVFEDEIEIIGTVCINEYHTFVKSKNGDVYSLFEYIQEPLEELEVIGNIYDNPELMEV